MTEVFVRQCKEKFQFLVDDFECSVVSAKADRDTACVTYQNKTTAIGVHFDGRDAVIWVVLMRLLGGQRPDYDDPFNSHGLGHLVRLRSESGRSAQETVPRPLTPDGVERILGEQSTALRTYAADVLRGDFSVFPELAEMEQEMVEEFEREFGGASGLNA